MPPIDLSTNIAYMLTLIGVDNRTHDLIDNSGTDSAIIGLKPRPSASASGAAATVTVTAEAAAGGNPALGPALGLGLGLGLPLLVAAVAAALLFRRWRAERARRLRGAEGIATGPATAQALGSKGFGASGGDGGKARR